MKAENMGTVAMQQTFAKTDEDRRREARPSSCTSPPLCSVCGQPSKYWDNAFFCEPHMESRHSKPNRGIVMSKKGDEKPAKKVTEIKVYPAAQFHIKLSDKMTAQEIKKVEKALEIPFSGVVRIQAFAHRVIITNTLSEDHHEEMKPIFTAAIEKALAK